MTTREIHHDEASIAPTRCEPAAALRACLARRDAFLTGREAS
jgi:hypothetical protein